MKRDTKLSQKLTLAIVTNIALTFTIIGILTFLIIPFLNLEKQQEQIVYQLATVIISTGIIGIAYQYLMRKAFFNEINFLLRDELSKHFHRTESIIRNGVLTIEDSLTDTLIVNGIENAKHEVRILQTWMGNLVSLENCIETAINNGCEIKILLLKEDSIHVEFRNKEISYSDIDFETVKGSIKQNIVRLKRLYRLCKKSKKLKVKQYDGTPIMSMYWFDETCYMGLFWRNKSAIQSPQIHIDCSKENSLSKLANQHFEDIWINSDDVVLE